MRSKSEISYLSCVLKEKRGILGVTERLKYASGRHDSKRERIER
jgi:hypothetical protein